jgi:hypothetical protein
MCGVIPILPICAFMGWAGKIYLLPYIWPILLPPKIIFPVFFSSDPHLRILRGYTSTHSDVTLLHPYKLFEQVSPAVSGYGSQNGKYLVSCLSDPDSVL